MTDFLLSFSVVWLLFMSGLLYRKTEGLKQQIEGLKQGHDAKLDAMQAQMDAQTQGRTVQGRTVPIEGGRALLVRLIDEHNSRRPGSNGNA